MSLADTSILHIYLYADTISIIAILYIIVYLFYRSQSVPPIEYVSLGSNIHVVSSFLALLLSAVVYFVLSS